MTPSAQPDAAATTVIMSATRHLYDGEVILLAVKPSIWYAVFVSAPVIAIAVLSAGSCYLGAYYLGWRIPLQPVAITCAGIALLRILIGCFQWMGRLYVLTNLRILSIRGVLKAEVSQCSLKRILNVAAAKISLERMLGLGSLFFEVAGEGAKELAWLNIHRPQEAQQAIIQAIKSMK